MGIRSHLAAKAEPIVLKTVEHQTAGMKPKGFWYEVDGDWRRWCAGEQFDVDRHHLHEVNLGDTNMLVLDTLAKLDAFHDQHGQQIIASASSMEVDWAPVAAEYDGIEIAPYQWARRFDFLWYYGWDCASGCIWRPKSAIVTYVAELPDDWHQSEDT